MAQTKVRPLERKVLRDTVYETLVDMLMSNTLAPETPLSIDALANELAVSPTPVREHSCIWSVPAWSPAHRFAAIGLPRR
ncbi:MAG: GntR family transcriptional regulator [Propionibacterium sp.]|nr:GntR family transcriptional regulator [Propionibacterium sp.]